MLDLSKYREIRGQTKWTTKDGDEYPIKRMEVSHIQNTIILLTNKQKSCEELSLGDLVIKGVKAADWIELLKTELKFRQDPNSICPKKVEPVKEETLSEVTEEVEERRAVML